MPLLYITHKLNEVLEISDRITVLRRGQSIETVETKNVAVNHLVEMMVGKKVDLELEKPICQQSEELLRVDGLYVSTKENKHALQDISFTLHGGEILGVAGVAGSGQKEICETIAGLLPAEKGRIIFENKITIGKSPWRYYPFGYSYGLYSRRPFGYGIGRLYG